MFLLLGLSVSFHILVGFYATLCVMFSIIINYNYFINDIKKIFGYIFLYFISSAFGIYAIIKTLFENQTAVDKKLAGIIYVTNTILLLNTL